MKIYPFSRSRNRGLKAIQAGQEPAVPGSGWDPVAPAEQVRER